MSESQPPVQIRVVRPEDEDYADLTDVGVVNLGGERHLILKPQPFDSAVRQVRSAMPDLPMEQVERLLREYPADFRDFNDLLGSAESVRFLDITPMPGEPVEPVRVDGRAKWWVVGTVLALAASWVLGYATATVPVRASASASETNRTYAVDAQPTAKPFVGPEFLGFSKAGRIDCKPIADLEAECTGVDGMVMSTVAAIGAESTIFMFSYGSERIGLRIFYDSKYATTWTRQAGTQKLYPDLRVHGRYVMWGTDPGRIGEYMGLIEDEDRRGRLVAMGGQDYRTSRLAALTVDTPS
ncbi:hypothetical protein ACFWCA_19690 [Streptomyces phaeochromogenes]|uniref:hypothetical protein n=1 Tax=Streptomyces phaeochromogenes TaxID=1923 RepID=UPI0036A890ED